MSLANFAFLRYAAVCASVTLCGANSGANGWVQPMAKRKKAVTTEEMVAFLAESRMEQATEYARRGRRLKEAAAEKLKDGWKIAFKKYAAAPTDPMWRLVVGELQAEMELRGVEPPFEDVKPEMDALTALAQKVAQEILADPIRTQEIGEGLLEDIEAMKRKRLSSPKN